MRIKLIKLVQNELIKIFKRKSIYLLFLISIIAIIIYNNINPDQNQIVDYNSNTSDYNVESIENALKNSTGNMDEYITQKESIDFGKLYDTFKEGSWQRYALKEEISRNIVNNVYTDYNLDIMEYLKNINDYELNPYSEISQEEYEIVKIKYNEYVEALSSNDWKQFASLKIKNLKERKNTETLVEGEIEEINLEIEYYNLRLENNINFGYDIENQYLKQYKSNYYGMKLYSSAEYDESWTFIKKNINENVAKMNLCKYAIENNINYDISNNANIIYDNKIDARISFIRTFEHFDLIIVIIAIYIGATIVTEETNKRTIKNLLTKPHKRSTILISKILACVITIIVSMVVIVITQYIVGGIILGFDSYDLNYIGYDFKAGQVFTMNLFSYILLVGLSKIPMYLIISLFCIFIGIINNHTAMSMSLALIIFLVSSTLLAEWSKVEALSVVTRFFATTNWDFSIYLFGQVSDISGVTLGGSILNCIIHFVILIWTSIHCFKNKEINNVG